LRYSISAHIPFFNNIDTLEQVIQSISSEGINLRDVSIYDDGSSTDPSSICKSTNTTLHQYKRNKGRGFIRNKATSDAESDLILFCDATNLLSDNFIKNALHYFEQKQVAAVSGKSRIIRVSKIFPQHGAEDIFSRIAMTLAQLPKRHLHLLPTEQFLEGQQSLLWVISTRN